MRSHRYILKGKYPVPEPDLLKWGKWFEKADRKVKQTNIGDVNVSTIFLGLDHNFSTGGLPILFETLVFGGPLDGEMSRYPVWGEAEVGHEEMVERVRRSVEKGGES